MSKYRTVDKTETGYKKMEPVDGEGKPLYFDPNGNFTKQQAFAASKQQEKTVTVRERDTGRFSHKKPRSEVKEVDFAKAGERGATEDAPTFMFEVSGPMEAEAWIQQNPDAAEAFQLWGLWALKCSGESDDLTAKIGGWSKVHDDINRTFEERFPVEEVDPDTGTINAVAWETREVRTAEKMGREAEDHAWSKITCSPLVWHNVKWELKVYASKQSATTQEAREYTHIGWDL